MILVSPEDRDVLRFLWVDDIQKKLPKIVDSDLPILFLGSHWVLFYSTLLSNTTLKGTGRSVQILSKLSWGRELSADDDENAYELQLKSKQVLAEGGFSLWKFVTNSADLHQRIEQSESHFLSECPADEGSKIEEEDKTCTKNLLGVKLRYYEKEQKILGMRCYNFIFICMVPQEYYIASPLLVCMDHIYS